MALVKCKECEKDVSDQADKCPHCGISFPAISNEKMEVIQQAVHLKVETSKMHYLSGFLFFGGVPIMLMGNVDLGWKVSAWGFGFYLLAELIRNLEEKKLKNKLEHTELPKESSKTSIQSIPSQQKKKGIGFFGWMLLVGCGFFIYNKYQESIKTPDQKAADLRKSQQESTELTEKLNATRICSDAIKAILKNPSSAKIHDIMGTTFLKNQAGNFKVSIKFEAKNDLGIEIENTGFCTVSSDYKLIDFQTNRN
jgi:hypothetical protein